MVIILIGVLIIVGIPLIILLCTVSSIAQSGIVKLPPAANIEDMMDIFDEYDSADLILDPANAGIPGNIYYSELLNHKD
jgi:hypothetical protein